MKRAVYSILREDGERYYNIFCECGFKHTKRNEKIEVCEGCKESIEGKYVCNDIENKEIKEAFDRYENVVESQTGFEVHHIIDRYVFNGEGFKFESSSKPYKLIVDFKNNNYKLVDRKGNESKITEGRCRQFFHGTWDFKNVLNLDSNKMFIGTIEPLGKLKTSYEESAARAFDKAFKDEKFVRCIQILVSAKVPVDLITKLTVSNMDGYYYYGYGREISYKFLNFNESKPHKILNTEKSNLEILKYWSKSTDYNEWIKEINKYNKNDIKYIINILENELGTRQAREFFECIKDFNEIVYEYKYKPRELAKYLVRDVRLEQGIDKPQNAMTLLKDLNKMCRDMRIKPKEKLSRSLKLHHDIATMNYKVSVDTYKKNRFIDIVNKEEYKEKEYKNKDLQIIVPAEPNALIREGKSMSHCVASYIDSVLNKKCKIYFVRNNQNIDKSLVTVEVRNDKIVQAKAFANASPTKEQKEFISLWAKNKNLVESYY